MTAETEKDPTPPAGHVGSVSQQVPGKTPSQRGVKVADAVQESIRRYHKLIGMPPP